HTLIGAGAAEGAIDAANMLKPALARGEIQCVGATTLTEYRKYIEKDSALERRFQAIHVKEPSIEDTILILKGLRKAYETHHRVRYPDDVIELAVRLSERYITDRHLPDKSIDIIDESGSRARLANSVRPAEITDLEDEIKALVQKKDDMVKAQEYEKAAQIRDEINTRKEVLEETTHRWQERIADFSVEIRAEDIYSVVSLWTGIPLEQIEEGEADKLLKMDQELARRVVGQKEAVDLVSRAVRRSRTGFKDSRKPSGSFIFLGPTGVGKTELARALAEFLFGNEAKLFRLDMSEYMEPHSVSKLIGSPPGYVGYDDAGQLSEFVRRNPYSVVLLDEIEKAHPDIFNLLLQILEEGTLTDTHGRKVDFRETIIIMTSNLGAREMHKGGKM
ncbi:MAG TPA: ATP-dependent Clp protease ATP-binding subunit, partial [Leptospiraceae bacterium]|nr:ATP-dependent Clp protease ATP-binding subunit [Leptospiraceae bacterium]